MKQLLSLLAVLLISTAGFGQKGIYVKYETSIDASGEEGEMMAMMMNGSTMEVASGAERTWVKTQMGTMMTMEMQMDMDSDTNLTTMFMSGMMGNMAFQGNPDDLADEGEEEISEPNIELTDETKKILGETCKKAVITDTEGNIATYWYTENFDRPRGMEQMPNQIPGLCLEFEVGMEGMSMKYTAIEFNDKIKINDYEVEIPDGVEIQSLEDMKNMGTGGM